MRRRFGRSLLRRTTAVTEKEAEVEEGRKKVERGREHRRRRRRTAAAAVAPRGGESLRREICSVVVSCRFLGRTPAALSARERKNLSRCTYE